MKKRVLSLFMALMLCLTLLPTAALADELGPADGTSAVETAGADADADAEAAAKAEAEEKAEAEAKAKADAEAAAAVQAQIDALPSADELPGMSGAARDAAYLVALSVYDTYEDLTAEQQAQITGAEKLTALLGWFSSQVAVLDTSFSTACDGVDEKTGKIIPGAASGSARGDIEFTANTTQPLENLYYVVKQNTTVDGDLSINTSGNGGLVLCSGITLEVTGALILNGSSSFFIYGQSESDGKNTGRLVINNHGKDGAAIRSESTSAPTLDIYSGALTIYSGTNGTLVDGVKLSSANKIHAAALNRSAASYTEWSNVTPLKGTSLVLEYCKHPDDYDSYVDNNDNGLTHHLKCDLCGFEWLKDKGAAKSDSEIEHAFTYTDLDETYHKGTCVECDAVVKEAHETSSSTEPALTPDHRQHITGGCKCGHDGTAAPHTYNKYGTCETCYFTPIATDTVDGNGNATGSLYASIEDALKNNAAELWLVSYEKDPTTTEYTNTLQQTLEIGEGVGLTLHMNNVKLEGGTFGKPALTVNGGSLTIEDAAEISCPDATSGVSGPAIVVKSGALTFHDALNAQGGTSSSGVNPAIRVMDGTVNFDGAVTATGSKSSSAVASAIEVSGGTVTFGNTVDATAQSISPTQVGTVLGPAINVTGGTVTFVGDVKATGGYSEKTPNFNAAQAYAIKAAKVSKLDFLGDLNLSGGLSLYNAAVLVHKLTKGTFTAKASSTNRINVDQAMCYALLGKDLAFMKYVEDQEPGDVVSDAGAYINVDVTIGAHTHDWTNGSTANDHSCACGASEGHKWDENGVCTVCHYECLHTAVSNGSGGEEDIYTCGTCHARMNVGITVSGSTTETYGTDFKKAMEEAADGTTITLLNDINNSGTYACITGDSKTVTLNLNGHTISEGWIYVGIGSSSWSDPNNFTSSRLNIVGSGSFKISGDYGNLSVGKKATLDLSDWGGKNDKTSTIARVQLQKSGEDESILIVGENTGTIGNLTLPSWPSSGIKTKLTGGTYGKISIVVQYNSEPFHSILETGYVFQHTDTGEYVEYEKTATNQGNTISNVKVVECQHSGITENINPETGVARCKYCNKGDTFVATVDGNGYTDMDKAISNWLADVDESNPKADGVLTLYEDYAAKNANDAVWSVGYRPTENTIDLNGHTMSVEGGGAFVPSNNMSLTVKDSKGNGKDGSISSIRLVEKPVKDGEPIIHGCQSLTLQSGCIDNLEVEYCAYGSSFNLEGGSVGSLNVTYVNYEGGIRLKGGSLGKYTLPAGTVLADIMGGSNYYAEGTSLENPADNAAEKGLNSFAIKTAPAGLDFAQGLKTAAVPLGGEFPFTVTPNDSTLAGVYTVTWFRRTDTGVVAMVDNKVTGVDASETPLDVFCVITGWTDGSNTATVKWQMAFTGYQLTVEPTSLNSEKTKIEITNAGGFVYSGQDITPTVKVTYDGKDLTEGTDYTVVPAGSSGRDAGTYTLRIEGKDNYKDAAEQEWNIEQHPIGMPASGSTLTIKKPYDGTATVSTDDLVETSVTFTSTAGITSISEMTLTKVTDFTISGEFDDNGNVNVGEHHAEFTIALEPNGNYIFSETQEPYEVQIGKPGTITPATAGAAKPYDLYVVNNLEREYLIDPAELLPTLPNGREFGTIGYGQSCDSALDTYYSSDFTYGTTIKNGKTLLWLKVPAVEKDDEKLIGNVTYTAKTQNYGDITLTVKVNATNKIVPTGEPTLSAKTLTYGQALSVIKLSGTMKDGGTTVSGKFTWMDGDVKLDAGTHEVEWKFTPDDTDKYLDITGKITITVKQAKPAGEPIYTKITAAKKTLADANLKPNTSWPTGTIQWVDKDGKELENTTEVKANTAYAWKFTPTGADADNYTTAEGTVILYSVSTGGGGGGSSSGTTVKTDTSTNPDGSTTKTETKSDGTVVETTTAKDGSVTKTTTKKDGSSVTESKDANGSTGTVKTDKNGRTEASAKISDKAVSDAKSSGEAVKVPAEVKAGTDSSSAPTVKIDLPANSGETKIEIPVSNVDTGTVAVIVHPDGTEEIVKDSIPTENGVQLTVNGDATVKVMDNSKNFTDTVGHWSEKNIDFVSARGLLNGTSDTTFSPNAPTTRAQLWTVLARQADADLTGGANWFEKAQAWSVANGISDGTNPNGTITRAQMVAMLWRAAGSPAPKATTRRFSDVMDDSYYADAVAWAVENGVTTGTKDGKFDPYASCTRAQIAAFLYRLYLSR